MSTIVLIWDTLGALAAKAWGFDYGALSPGSVLIYAVTAGLIALRRDIHVAVLGAALVGLAESTVGWVISWNIGPGRLPAEDSGVVQIALTIPIVVIIAAATGFAAAWLTVRIQRTRKRMQV